MTDQGQPKVALDYVDVGVFRRLVRRTAATRPMTWVYIRIQHRIDQLVYRLTRGRVTASSLLSGLPVVMLTTTGARTGLSRTVPVLGIPDRGRVVVIADNYGRSHHPAWYHNLRAHPQATVTVDGVEHRADAHELTGHERDECLQEAAKLYPGFIVYEERAVDRAIPVIRFDLS